MRTSRRRQPGLHVPQPLVTYHRVVAKAQHAGVDLTTDAAEVRVAVVVAAVLRRVDCQFHIETNGVDADRCSSVCVCVWVGTRYFRFDGASPRLTWRTPAT